MKKILTVVDAHEESLQLDLLKKKAIRRYNDFLIKLRNGYNSDYTDILDLICFINLPARLDNHAFIGLFLLNYDDTGYLHFRR